METQAERAGEGGRAPARASGRRQERSWGRPHTLLGHLWRLREYAELWRSLTRKEIRIRYKQSMLGIGWAVRQPVAMMIVFTIVFSRLLHVQSGKYP